MELALGTVQFGLPYGVANTSGQVDSDTVATILQHARFKGIDTLDTAIAYGESEQCLGNVGVDGWRVISKLPALPEKCADVSAWVNEQVRGSLSRLNIPHLAGILLHRPDELLGSNGKELWAALQSLKQNNLVEKTGFSIYEPDEMDSLWNSFRPDLVQAPYNILDQRLSASGWLQRMYDDGVEVHARSVFLQGLLLMNEKDRPTKFDRWATVWSAWDTWLSEQGITSLQACLAFIMGETRISKAIVGVDSLSQLKEILGSTETSITDIPQEFAATDLELINPSLWNSL